MVATAVLLSVEVMVPAYTVFPKFTMPVNVGAANGAFKSNAACVAVEILFSKSVVFSTLSIPNAALALIGFVAPVPPFTIATTPVTFVALPVNVPEKFPTTELAVIVVALKLPLNKFAVIVLPAKSPFPLRSTIVLIKL